MFTAEIMGYLSHAQELTPDLKRDLFQGLDKMAKTEGRIYKKIDSHGREKFFKAKSFWSSVYHFFFSSRMSENDLRSLNNRVTYHINNNSKDLKLTAKVEATYIKVLCKVNTNSTWFFPREEVFNNLLKTPHSTLINNAANKISNELPITSEELLLFRRLHQAPDFIKTDYFNMNVINSLTRVNDRYDLIAGALRSLNRDSEVEQYATSDVTTLVSTLGYLKNHLKNKSVDLSETQANEIRNAERVLANLQRKYKLLDLQNFKNLPGLKNLFDICSYSVFIKPEVKNISSIDSDTQPIGDNSTISSRPIIESLEDRLTSLLMRVPTCKFPSNLNTSSWLKIKEREKKDFEIWLKANIDNLPAYFKPSTPGELLKSLGAECSKEFLRIKYGIAVSDISPFSYNEWKDIPPSYLYIPQDTAVYFYDLSPGSTSDLVSFQKVFKGDWKSQMTTVGYSLEAWFSFISICRENNITQVNPLDHLKNAFKTMKDANIAKLKLQESYVYSKDDEVYSRKDWLSFVSICNKKNIQVDAQKHEPIFISIALEKLINDIIAEERNVCDYNLIEPYLDVLNSPTVQRLTLPDRFGMTVSEEIYNVFNDSMHRAAIYLWNALKDQKIITSNPNELLIKSAKGLNIDLK